MNFINVILNKINDENKNYIYFLFLLNTGIQILISSILPFSLSADSYHYLQIAERFDILNVNSLNPGNRSVGYPLFLYFLGSKTFLGGTFIIILQCIMAILIPVLTFIFLSNNSWKNQLNIAKILSLFISIFPYFHYMSSQIMSEILFIFLLVLSLFYLENFFKKKNIKSFFYLILIFTSVAIVRPTGIVFFYLISITVLVMGLTKIMNFKKFIFISFFIFCGFFIFEKQNSPYAKSFFKFIAFSQHTAVGFCNIKDQNKINRIKDRDWALVPDERNYLVIKKDKSKLNDLQIKSIYKEKCLNLNNPGKKTQKYISIVIDLLNNKDEPLKNTLTSTYNIAGSPDKPNPEYDNLSAMEILKKVHSEYIFPLPFQHIWWRLAANIGASETNKLITGVIIETTIKNPEVWIERYNFMQDKMNPFNIILAPAVHQSGKDMFFWRFIPNPYLELKDQNAAYLTAINHKLYLQNVYSLEKMIGKDIDKIYNKNFRPYVEAEKGFFKNYKNLIFENFNPGTFAAKILWQFNYILFNIIKILIILFIPILSILYFSNKIIKKNKLNDSDYLAIFFGIFGYIGIAVSIFFFWDPRHVMMHFVVFLPAITILLSRSKT